MKTIFVTIGVCLLSSIYAQNTEYKQLVFEGAGIRGLAYSGVVKQLEELQIIDQIEKVGGTSAGAITALMVALGYSSDEIYDLVSETKFHKFNDGGFVFFGGIHRMNKKFGWYKGDKFLQWTEAVIESKTGDPEITFASLKEQGFKDLYVTATCLNRQKLLVLSAETYPQMKVKDAIRISMSVPLYFEAIFIDDQGRVYDHPGKKENLDIVIDGGILANFPIGIFDQIERDSLGNETRIPNPHTLGVRIDTDEQIDKDSGLEGLAPFEVNDLRSYMQAFFVIVVESLNRNDLMVQDWERTISVSSVGIGPKIRRLKESEKKRLAESGELATLDYFNERVPGAGFQVPGGE